MRTSPLLGAFIFFATACARPAPDGVSESADTNGVSLTDPVGVAPATGASFSEQKAPAVATNGTDYVVAWTDIHRASDGKNRSTVRAAHLGSDGALLTHPSLELSTQTDGEDLDPVIASDGAGYLVAWTHWVQPRGSLFGTSSLVQAVRLDANGKVLDATPIALGRVSTDPYYPAIVESPAIAFNGTDYLITWSDNRERKEADRASFNNIYGARLGRGGAVHDGPIGFRISATGTPDWKRSSVASAGSTFLVTAFAIRAA